MIAINVWRIRVLRQLVLVGFVICVPWFKMLELAGRPDRVRRTQAYRGCQIRFSWRLFNQTNRSVGGDFVVQREGQVTVHRTSARVIGHCGKGCGAPMVALPNSQCLFGVAGEPEQRGRGQLYRGDVGRPGRGWAAYTLSRKALAREPDNRAYALSDQPRHARTEIENRAARSQVTSWESTKTRRRAASPSRLSRVHRGARP